MTSGPRTSTNQQENTAIRNAPILDQSVGIGTNRINRSLLFGEEDANTGAARDLVGSTLQGDFLGQNNPFLEDQFNQGADAITQRLNTNFARSGRNISAARPVAADELGSLRAGIFGPAFERERDRQVAAVGQAQQLNPLDQFLERLQQLGGVTGREINSSGSATTREKKSVLDRVLGVASLF